MVDEANHRPVSILPPISKVDGKLLQKQINNYVENNLSPYLCGYMKGYSTQNALICLIEKWKKVLDKKDFCGVVLMELSKALDTINHKLLIGKINTYGFKDSALKLLLSYLSNRWQRTIITTSGI